MPGNPLSTDELIELVSQGVMFGGGTVLEGPGGIDQMAMLLRDHAHPDFVTVMVSESGVPQEARGIEGFRELLRDWISPYESFRLEIDDALTGDGVVVFLARQVGTTKHGGVGVEVESSSVWWIDEGRIRQAGFYLDRQAGLKAAGIDPGRQPGD
jgi:ketosteroid isomerase-like protein